LIIENWQRRRAELNHDRLKNDSLVYFGGLLNNLKDNSIPVESASEEVEAHLDDLGKTVASLRNLIAEFEVEMSPRILFCRAPLAGCSADTMAWLPDLCHKLWRRQNGIEDLTVKSLEKAAQLEQVIDEVRRCLANGWSEPHRNEIMRDLKQLVRVAFALSESVSRFPHEIRVL
jgi:hypothetical protein